MLNYCSLAYEVEAVHCQLIGQSDLQPLHAVGGLPALQYR
jgi:hypothetical protein